MATELNSDDVSAALLLAQKANTGLENQMKSKGYINAYATFERYGFTVWPNGLEKVRDKSHDKHGVSYAAALKHIDALPDADAAVEWTPSLCEQTLYAGVAA